MYPLRRTARSIRCVPSSLELGHGARRLVARGLGMGGETGSASHGVRLGRVLTMNAAQMPRRAFVLPHTPASRQVLSICGQIAGLLECLEWSCGPESGVVAEIEREAPRSGVVADQKPR